MPLVVGNHREAEPLAQFYKVPFHYIPVDAATRTAAETTQLALLRARRSIWWCSRATCRSCRRASLRAYPQRIINVHHSFLPAFIGAKPYHQAFERGVKLIGATSHYVTDRARRRADHRAATARISHRDQLADLLQKGRELEKVVLSRAVRWHVESRILVYGKKTVIFD